MPADMAWASRLLVLGRLAQLAALAPPPLAPPLALRLARPFPPPGPGLASGVEVLGLPSSSSHPPLPPAVGVELNPPEGR